MQETGIKASWSHDGQLQISYIATSFSIIPQPLQTIYSSLILLLHSYLSPWSDVILLRGFPSLLAKAVCSTFFSSTNTVTNTHHHAVRDSFETPKQDIEGRLSQILGQPWTIKVDPLALYAYAEEDSWASTSLGDLIVRSVSSCFLVSLTCEVILHSFIFHSLAIF